MELSVTQQNLSRALNNVSRVASAKAGLPILNNILLRTEKNRLVIAATNLEIAEIYTIGAKVAAPGSITIPSRLVAEFVSNLPKGPVDLKVEKNHLTITSGSYTSTLNGIAADEFPELPTIENKDAVSYQITADDFKKAVAQTIITCSSDSTRPVLTGVYWNTFEGNLYLAATDGYRLAEKRLMPVSSDIAAIIPATTLQEVLRTLSDETDTVTMQLDDTQVQFQAGDAEITSRLIDGNYPPYRELIPKKSETIVEIAHDEFSQITKVAGLFARDSGGSVTLTATAETNTLTLHTVASEVGENTSSASAKASSDGHVTLNSRYLNDALAAIDEKTVEFAFSGTLAPCLLTPKVKDGDYMHIIMPLKS